MKAGMIAKLLITGAAVCVAGYLTPALANAYDATGTCRVVWLRHHDSADYTSVAVSKAAEALIAGTYGEPAQVELIPLEGAGEPDWVFPGDEFVAVAAARDADVFAALDYQASTDTVTVYKWHRWSAIPDWSYTISPCAPLPGKPGLVVSADGSTICTLVLMLDNPSFSRMYCFNSDISEPICIDDSLAGFVPLRVAVSRYGDYIIYAVINMDTLQGRIFAVARDSCNRFWTGNDLTLGLGLALSPDGDYMAYDLLTIVPPGNKLQIRKWYDLLGYLRWCSHDQAGFLLLTLAGSWDFSTIVGAWASIEDPPEASRIKLFDMPSCDPSWTYTYASGQESPDLPFDSALTSDGSWAAVGSLTDESEANPEVLVFKHSSSQPVGALEVPGAVNGIQVDIALSACGGAYVACALSDGSGSDLYSIRAYEGVVTVCPYPPNDFETIQEAIDNASVLDGFLIELCDATFVGENNRDIDSRGKAITVCSQSGDPNTCVIDCEAAGRGFYFHSGEGECSVLRNITVANGFAPDVPGQENGGGIYCTNNSRPTIDGCAITGNLAYDVNGDGVGGDGGGIYGSDSSPAIMSCTIAGNRASHYGGGIYGACIPKRTIVWGNCADSGVGGNWYGDGGAIVSNCCDDLGPGLDGFGSFGVDCGMGPNIDENPVFCAPEACENAPTAAGDYRLSECSRCAPEQNPECGLVGALDVGCPPRCPKPGGSGRYCTADIWPNNGDGAWNDCDGDCLVDLSDLGRLLSNYGTTTGATHEDGDVWPENGNGIWEDGVDGDGRVDLADLGELLSQYGDDCTDLTP